MHPEHLNHRGWTELDYSVTQHHQNVHHRFSKYSAKIHLVNNNDTIVNYLEHGSELGSLIQWPPDFNLGSK